MAALYEKLAALSKVVLDAIGVGLRLKGEEHAALLGLKQDYQLRLLHYPAINREKIQNEMIARLPEHNDWW
jgi:isopenicillin N synthase-like dioxygenase